MMNRSFFSTIAGAKGKALACAVIAALSVMLLLVVCSKDDPPPGGGNTDPCATADSLTTPECPGYCPPTQYGCPGYDPNVSYCDYGFGNCSPTDQASCGEYGVLTTSCPAADAKYCNFGQPTQYGNGGCYFRPNAAVCDASSNSVTMTECIQSNTSNACIANATSPGGSGDNASGCNQYVTCTAPNTPAGCTPGTTDPCEGAGSNPSQACCVSNSNYPGCTPTDPCIGGATQACCTSNPSYPGCGPTDPCVSNPGSTACCTATPGHLSCLQSGPKYCYWAPNKGNSYTGACVEIGGQYCAEASCQTEAGCTGNSGSIKTTSDCDGLPIIGTDPCIANSSLPECTDYPSTGTYCYWPASGGNAASCEAIGGPFCQDATCTEALCRDATGTVITDCSNPPTANYCDYGPPAIVGGQTIGGCHPTTNPTCDEGGTMVAVCPDYPPPTTGGYCDYGFGNCIPSSEAACNSDGAFTQTCPASSGKYCDFGQPTQYGDGGCYFRPNVAVCDEWSDLVTMQQCITSNTTNPTISNPCSPGGGNYTCK